MIIRLLQFHLTSIQEHARSCEPNECCGLLTGQRVKNIWVINSVHPSKNVTTGDPTQTFEIDPKLRFDLMRAHQDNAMQEIIGHYHSHPTSPALPSETDLKMTYETHFIWLICGQNGQTNAFKPRDDRSAFDIVSMELTD